MKLVQDAKRAWRWFSVQAMVVVTALQGAWVFIPEDMKNTVPKNIVHWITIGLLFFGVAGRLVQQAPKAPK